jgi:hypothetical protein
MASCSGPVFNSLDFTTIYGLKTLNINSASNTIGDKTINLYLPIYDGKYKDLNEDEKQELISQGVDVLWHGLQSFNARYSSLKTIGYGVSSTPSGVCDFAQLTKLTSLNIRDCKSIIEIKDLQYRGSLYQLFYNCNKLTTISGELTATNSDISYIFCYCYRLKNFSHTLKLNLTKNQASGAVNVTNASYACHSCQRIDYDSVKHLLDSMPSVTNLTWFLYGGFNMSSESANAGQAMAIPDDMFENNTQVTRLDLALGGTHFTSAPDNLFIPMKNTLTNVANIFNGCSKLTTVGNSIFKECDKLTTVTSAFLNCSALKNFFNGSHGYNIFASDNKITSTSAMFAGCKSLTMPTSGTIKDMFDSLINLENSRGMFYNCTWLNSIPDGVFEKCTKLKNIDYTFMGCTGVTALPKSLFYLTNVPTTTTHHDLKLARGLFYNCTNMTGQIASNFFAGAEALEDIGHCYTNNNSYFGSYYYMFSGGMFGNTKIFGFDHDFLFRLTNLKSASLLFFKGVGGGAKSGANAPETAKNSFSPSSSHANSAVVWQTIINGVAYPLSLYADIFSKCTKLTDVRYAFAGNTQFTKFIKLNEDGTVNETVSYAPMFESCKGTITNLEGLFAKCTGLNASPQDSLFKGLGKLKTARACFADCTNLSGNIPSDMLDGCVSLSDTSAMFLNCKQLGDGQHRTDVAIPSNLFDSCRATINDVSYMFSHCEKLNGILQPGYAEVTKTDVENDDGTVTTNTTFEVKRNGLLAECTNLTSAAYMFANCWRLKGSIPEDMFYTSSAINTYNGLENLDGMFDGCTALSCNFAGISGGNYRTIYTQEGERGYFVPYNWLTRCPNVKNISRIFNQVANPVGSYTLDQMTIPSLILEDGVFTYQTKLEDASYAFAHVKSIAGTNLTAVFMQNSLNTLKKAQWIFGFSALKSAGAEENVAMFEKNVNKTAKNTTLNDISYAFYYANHSGNGMTGYGPNMTRFTSITNSESMMTGQNNLSNYSSYSVAQTSVNSSIDDSSHRTTYNYNKNNTINFPVYLS